MGRYSSRTLVCQALVRPLVLNRLGFAADGNKVISVEKDSAHYAFICKVMELLKTDKCFPIRGDVFKFLDSTREKFDFIFADPPYALPNLADIPRIIFEKDLLKEDGIFILEHGKENNFEDNPHFIERRVYGSVNFSIFSKAKD